jgi:hypothetical protein
MSSISLTALPELLGNEVFPVMFQRYENTPKMYPMLCEVEPCDAGFRGQKGTVITNLGQPVELHEGEEVPADSMAKAYTWYLKGRPIGRRIDIALDDLAANDASVAVVDKLRRAASDWGEGFAIYKEEKVAGVFQKGTLSAGHVDYFDGSFPGDDDPYPTKIYDGKPFFAASGNGHPLAANTATPYNLTVSLSLSQSNLQTVMTTITDTNAIDDRGRKVIIRPDTLLVPPGLEFAAKTIINSNLVPGSANNDANVVAGALDVAVWRFLSDSASASAWWVGSRGKGIKCRDSGAPAIAYQVDQVKRVVSIIASGRFGVGVTDWRFWYAANKATS